MDIKSVSLKIFLSVACKNDLDDHSISWNTVTVKQYHSLPKFQNLNFVFSDGTGIGIRKHVHFKS